ncbi:toxin co-regulated pilus biosynthesis Q family protein [Burkholderia cenocepacia]|uniref:toxin co-regulated pilus biosynthesis Q family protein n=1 Tax=Burkholderia cenocepacia TaxID=95486 RepID=UPI002011CF55|nr:toxin co-regulated pilus biosynthesis Q family protein [Burkholderia cenocepacia]
MNAVSKSVAVLVGVLSCSTSFAAVEASGSVASSVVHIAPYKETGTGVIAAKAPAEDVSTTSSGASAAVPIATAVPEKGIEPFGLVAGKSIQSQLQAWAVRAGWTVVWDVQQDWIVPNAATFTGDFVSAAQQVIEALAANGADVRADLYTGNRSMVVHQAGNE